MSADIRVELPASLSLLARAPREITLPCLPPVTQNAVLDALEAAYPMLIGTIRNRHDKRRRPFIRFFACQHDLSHDAPDALLPLPVATGEMPLLIIGAIAGG